MPRRRNRLLPLLLLMCAVPACTSTKSVFPSSGSLALDLVDSDLRYQSLSSRGSQIVRWTIKSARVDVAGSGSYDFLGVSPCNYTKNVLTTATLESACGGSNIVLGTGTAWTATVHLAISAMEVRRAFAPDLPAAGDYDGDGIVNGVDNCPLVPNPDQELSGDGTHGVACTLKSPLTGALGVDSDGDGVADSVDDCILVPDPGQTDSNVDGIGNACEQVAHVVLGQVPLTLDLSPVTVTVKAGALSTLYADFDDRKVLEGCDERFTRCALNADAIAVIVK
jgi:hypothetical protein